MCINMRYYGSLYEIADKELWSGCGEYPNQQGNWGVRRDLEPAGRADPQNAPVDAPGAYQAL